MRAQVGIGIACVVVVVAWIVLRDRDAQVHAEAPQQAGIERSVTTSSSAPRSRLHARLIDRATRARLVDALTRLRDKAPDTGKPETAKPEAEPDSELREYIRDAVREIVPLLAGCYEEGLERTPGLAGTVVVSFTIQGDPAVGGVIADSAIDDGSDLPNDNVRECIRETMYAIQIDPPASGEVHVRYPFVFRPAR